MLIKNIALAVIGLASGFAIAGGTFAFITWLGLVNRLATKTKTATKIMLYEDMVVLGAGVGNLFYLFDFMLPIGVLGIIVYGLFSGIFAGCLSIALAEVIQVIPVFAKRSNLKIGMSYIILSLAVGKSIGTIYQMFFANL